MGGAWDFMRSAAFRPARQRFLIELNGTILFRMLA